MEFQKPKDKKAKVTYDVIVIKGAKKVSELISATMELQRAPADLIPSQKTTLEILQDMLTQDCIQECIVKPMTKVAHLKIQQHHHFLW